MIRSYPPILPRKSFISSNRSYPHLQADMRNDLGSVPGMSNLRCGRWESGALWKVMAHFLMHAVAVLRVDVHQSDASCPLATLFSVGRWARAPEVVGSGARGDVFWRQRGSASALEEMGWMLRNGSPWSWRRCAWVLGEVHLELEGMGLDIGESAPGRLGRCRGMGASG